jgi:hypothetical protein
VTLTPAEQSALKAKRRTRNWVLAGLLMGWVGLIYAISIARMGGPS